MNPSIDPDHSAVRALHFADVHFGVETYGRYDPATGLNSRLTDFKRSLTSCLDVAIELGAEIALFAGDAYKTRDPSQTHQRAFAESIGLLTSAGIPVVLLAGNHDIPNTRGKANALEIYGAIGPGLITVLDKPGVVTVKTKTGRELQIAAIPYLTKSDVLAGMSGQSYSVKDGVDLVTERYEELVIELAAQCAKQSEIPTVLLAHFTVVGSQIAAIQSGYLINESQVSKSALQRDEFDYIALGHIHRHQDLNFPDQPPIVYCGSPDRIDFGEHAEQKGAVIVDIVRGHADYRFIESKSRPFLNIVMDATKPMRSIDGEDAVFDPTDTILAAIAKQNVDGAVVKLIYKVAADSLPILREQEIRKALRTAAIVVSMQREVIGASDTSRMRSPLTADISNPLAALSAYIDTRESLSSHKSELIERAEEMLLELTRRDAS